MLTVCIESPLRGDYIRNTKYARACLRWCTDQGYSAYASHLLLTQVLNDKDPADRERGIQAGLAMGDLTQVRIFFVDLGLSEGMGKGMLRAQQNGQETRKESLGEDWEKTYDEVVAITEGASGSEAPWTDCNYEILMEIFHALEPTEGVTSFSCLEPAVKKLIELRRGKEHIYDPLAKPDLDPDTRIWMWTYVGRNLTDGEWRIARVRGMLLSTIPTIWRLFEESPSRPKLTSFVGLRAGWEMLGDNDDD